MAASACTDSPARQAYYSSMASGYFQDPSFHSMPPIRNYPKGSSRSPYPLSALYVKYVRRAWKRVSNATRKRDRASVLPDGFVLINNARLNAASKRRSVMFA